MAKDLKPKYFKNDEGGSAKKDSLTIKTSNKKNKALPEYKDSGIPNYVANRMARRVAITTGIPTISGMSVFIVSYLVISRGIADIAPGITLISSAACFLIGLFGLSYGILSASWEILPGSLLGLENIRPNIERVRAAFGQGKKTSN